MTESLFVNADWSALVPAGSTEAAFGITPKDAKRRGLLPLEKDETLGEPEKLASANLLPEPETPSTEPEVQEEPVAETEPAPEPEAKAAPTPANKAAKKPANKGKDA